MTPAIRILACGAAVFLAAAACAGPRRGPPPPGGMPGQMRPITEQEQNIRLMLSFDGNSDGALTRDEMEAALRRQFEACDLNHDGRIDVSEMQAENDRRFKAFGTGASPLIDWNRNNQIEYDEFATTARSLFAEMDRDRDGQLGPNELRLPQVGRGRPIAREGGEGRGRRQ
jgi:Ca2+-binding EF-hand superfamily protein